MNNAPKHVAMIMDGNGRWARSRGLPRTEGHRAGMNTVREMVKASLEFGVGVLTLYAFSRENWKRPKEEVSLLMQLLNYFVDREVDSIHAQGVQIRTIGQVEALPTATAQKIRTAIEKTKDNKRMILNIALNYGSRQEILEAVKAVVREYAADPIKLKALDQLDENAFSRHLDTAGLPDPDLLVRTSGEMRISNFLLWQLSYTEIVISKKFWPDFTKQDYWDAIQEFQSRERRFGDVVAASGDSSVKRVSL